MLVASSGGHLLQLTQLKSEWPKSDRHWVTFNTADARSLLGRESVTFAYHPTNRNPYNLARNLGLAYRLIAELRPTAIVTTGAGVAVPFCYVGRLFHARVIYIETMSMISRPSLTARLVQPAAHDLFVQWPELVPSLRKARYLGRLL